MNAEYGDEYILGENITDIALSKKPRETVVVSVRLPVEDFKQLDKIISESGKSLSQAVREAIKAYAESQRLPGKLLAFGISFCPSDGAAFSVGYVESPTSSPCAPSITGIPEANLSAAGYGRPSPALNPEIPVTDGNR